MRAILVKNGAGPIENLFLGEAQRPKPSAKEVLVKVGAVLGLIPHIQIAAVCALTRCLRNAVKRPIDAVLFTNRVDICFPISSIMPL